MKRQIRRNVFETNSSSMHSLVILKDDSINKESELSDGMYIRKDGIWDIWNDDDLYFGRSPFQCLATFESKTRYAIASLCAWNNKKEEVFENIKGIVLEMIPKCKDIKLPKMYGYDDGRKCYGSVDEDILSGFLEKNNIDLKDFLVNKKYVVIVDGDEYRIYNDMKKSGIINKNGIEKEYPERNW